MSGGLHFAVRGLWVLAVTVSAASLGFIVADSEGMLGSTPPLSVSAPADFTPSPLPLSEGEPLFPLALAASPPVVIPLEFGPSPGRVQPAVIPAPEPAKPLAEDFGVRA